MHARNRSRLFAISLTLVLLASIMTVQSARADDGAPPPVAPSASSTASATTTANLSHIPADTDVVIVNHSGHKVPLASQEAAHIVAAGDPIWCPLGVAPKPGVGGCSPSQTGFSDVASWIFSANQPKAGVIWIEDSYNSNTNLDDSGIPSFTLDGFSYTTSSLYSLAIKGGWNGISGSTITNPADPSAFDHASLSIINWHAPVTISDIVVTGVTANPNEAYALSVSTDKGSITLNRVQVINNYSGSFAGGAHLNTIQATLLHPAPVTVNDSVFNDNFGNGLWIQSDGAINIRNITADANGFPSTAFGTLIDNTWDNPNQPVTFTGTNEFKGNYGHGLWIDSYGIVTLNNIIAISNSTGGTGYGLNVNNTYDSTPSIVKLTGTNLFSENGLNGLWIRSNGNILLNNITSTDNVGGGAYLDNCLKPAIFTACATTARTVTLTGINSFDRNNGGDGLNVVTSGAITVSQVTANDNNNYGVLLDNCAYDGFSTCLTPLPYNAAVTNASTFMRNGLDGLDIIVTGAVSLKNLTASSNHGNGAQIYNAVRLLAPRAVTIGGTNVFNGNSIDGLYVYSYGAITVGNLTANENGQSLSSGYGAYLDNRGYDGGLSGATVITRYPVTLTGINTLNNNYYGGLYVYSVGAISVSNVSASNNAIGTYYDGVSLSNVDPWYPNFVTPSKPYAANVTVSGFGFLEGNGWSGLEIFSRGAVTLANLTANNNYNRGADVDTTGFTGLFHTAPQNVTLTGVNTFYHNGYGSGSGDGLFVQNDGKITISNLTANNNQDNGAELNNYTWRWPGKFLGVTLTGFNTFDRNLGSEGLYIDTDGSAVLNHVNANLNIGTGVYITATKNVTLMCAAAFNNGTGFNLGGTIGTLTGVHAYYNGTDEALFFTTLHSTVACP